MKNNASVCVRTRACVCVWFQYYLIAGFVQGTLNKNKTYRSIKSGDLIPWNERECAASFVIAENLLRACKTVIFHKAMINAPLLESSETM